MVEQTFKKFMIPVAILVMAFIAFFIIKPIFTPIVLGLCLAYIFVPLYKKINKKIKSPNLSALIIIILTLLIVLVPLVSLMPAVAKETFNVYLEIRNVDFYNIIQKVAPSILDSKELSTEILAASSSFKEAISNFVLSFFQNTIMNLPQIIFGIIILLFTFFFAIRESDNFREYFTILFPFPKEYENRFFEQFDRVTNSVLYGQFMVGVFQGVIAAIGYYALGIPNALLLSILTAIVGVLPFVSPWLVWIPVDIFLFLKGMNDPALALLIYGLFVVNWIDTLLGPRIVSSRTQINPAIILIGLIGGVYAFGIIGILIGPLVLAYLILLIEIYKDKKAESIVFKKENPPAIP
jgi:predicted PurR-regulated permease PerM